MYAMLTGTLPFTVEPFSLRALYQKMVDKEMNPLPTQLSTGGCALSLRVCPTQGVRTPGLRGLRPSLFHGNLNDVLLPRVSWSRCRNTGRLD